MGVYVIYTSLPRSLTWRFRVGSQVDWLQQDPNKPAGDIVKENFPWARYPDGYPVWLGDGSVKNVSANSTPTRARAHTGRRRPEKKRTRGQ